MAVASGKPFLSLKTTETKVLLVDGELSPYDLGVRFRRIIGPNANPLPNLLVHTSRAHPEERGVFPHILEQIAAQPALDDVGLFIFDPFYRYIGAGSEIDCAEMSLQLENLQQFAFERNAAILLVHHFPKGNRSSNSHIEQIAGSSTISRSLDSLITLTRNNTQNCTNIEFTTRHFHEPETMVARWFANRFSIDHTVLPDAGVKNAQSEKKRQKISSLLERIPAEGIEKSELKRICDSIGIKKSSFEAYFMSLRNEGTVALNGKTVVKTPATSR